jgi:uncharacterized protein (DUF885 family)
MGSRTILTAILPLTVLAACFAPGHAAGAADPPGASANPMPALLDEFAADERGTEQYWSLPSDARRSHEEAVAADWRARLDALDFAALPREGQVDWLVLDNHLRAQARRREAEATRRSEVAELLPFAADVMALEEARWTLQGPEPGPAAGRLDGLARQVKALRERVKKKEDEPKQEQPAAETDSAAESTAPPTAPDAAPPLHPSAVHARRAAAEIDRLLSALSDWYRHDDAFRPDFSWWCASPYEKATQELRDYSKTLREDIAGLKGEDDDPLVGDPIGRQALLDELDAERVAATPEELIALGEAELAWCEAQMRVAAAELGHGEDWRAALAAVKDLHVAPGAQDDLVRGQALEAIAFLDARDLVSVPPLCRDTFRFTMIDEGTQKTLPFAAYGGQEMLVAFPTRAMEHDAKLQSMRGNNEHFSRIVTPHELVPGHHLQGYMAQRHATQRRFAGTPFLVEGWALYWELRLWDLGWARGPADRLGMLFWRAHRAARIVVSLKFHLGELTPPQMIDLLVERVGHERDNATSEVRRYVGGDYGPLYQCAYLVGGLQLAALHDELVGAGRMDERGFHDAVLRQGAIPVAFLRAALGDEPLSRDATPRLGVRRRA